MANVSRSTEDLNEAVNLFSRTTVLAVFYSHVIILYCLSFRLSYAQLRECHGKVKRQAAYTLVLQTVLLICATLDVIINNRHVQVAYIDNGALHGGPLGIPVAIGTKTLSNLDGVVNVLEKSLIVGVLLWRVRVVLSGTRFVTLFTGVSLFLYLASRGLDISFYAITWNVDDRSQVVLPQAGAIMIIMSLVICLANSAVITSAIIARLVSIRQQHIELMGKSDDADQYLSIAAMLIESYALNTTWETGLLISYGLNYAPTTYLFLNCSIQIDILTEFLLIYRVLSGRAWTRQTQNRLSTLRWAPNRARTTSSGSLDLRQTSVPWGDCPVISIRDGV